MFFACTPVFAADMVDINTASLQQLDALTGIGPTYAQRIVDGRPYSSVDDLLRVKGIGPATLQKIKDQGLACVNCSSAQTDQSQQQTQTSQDTNSQTTTQQPQQNSAGQQAADNSQPASQNLTPASPTAPAQTINVNYPSEILINEILPNPTGADELDEWIEIYNLNDFEVDLSGWKIQDSIGTITTYTFPAGTKINPQDYFILTRPQSKIMLNNSGDGLILSTPDGKTEDSMEFVNAPLGLSYNLTDIGWKWSAKLTPGAVNVIASNPVQTKPKNKTAASGSKGVSMDDKTAAALINDLPEEKPFSFLLFSGILLAVILGIIFFIIIIKLKTPDRSV